jgi:hypothetical protein
MPCEDCTQSAHRQWDCYSSACEACEKRMLRRMVEAIAAGQIKDEPQEKK